MWIIIKFCFYDFDWHLHFWIPKIFKIVVFITYHAFATGICFGIFSQARFFSEDYNLAAYIWHFAHVIVIHECLDLQTTVTNRSFYGNIFYLLRFCHKSYERKPPKDICFHWICCLRCMRFEVIYFDFVSEHTSFFFWCYMN